jgi:hypothetical protein
MPHDAAPSHRRSLRKVPVRRSRPAVDPAWLLATVGAWLAIAPVAAKAIGFGVHVPLTVEFADHAIPGAAIMVSAAAARRIGTDGSRIAGGAFAFLAAAWAILTHVPLVFEARGVPSAATATWHMLPAVAALIIAVVVWLREPRAPEQRVASPHA